MIKLEQLAFITHVISCMFNGFLAQPETAHVQFLTKNPSHIVIHLPSYIYISTLDQPTS